MAHAAIKRLSEYIGRGVRQLPADAELVRLVAMNQDQSAFTALVRRYGKAVRAACRRVLGDTPDVDDAFQATFLVFWRSAAKVRKTNSISAWLYGTAHRIACQARAAAARRRRHEHAATTASTSEAVPTDPSWREACGVLHEELDRLPDRYRLPLVLCYLHGFSRDEVAAKLGWSIGSVKGRLERGRERLKRRLTRRGIDLSAALLAAVAGQADAAMPAKLIQTAVEAALSGPTPTVATLISASGIVARAKVVAFAAVFALAMSGVGVGLLVRVGAAPNDTPADPVATLPNEPAAPVAKVALHGRVLDPNGNPVRDARLFMYQWPPGITPKSSTSDTQLDVFQQATTSAEGSFRFTPPQLPPRPQGGEANPWPVMAVAERFGVTWAKPGQADEEMTIRLEPDQPIDVRVVDSEARVVPKATVRVHELARFRNGRLDRFLTGWQSDWRDALYADFDTALTYPPDTMVRVTGPDREGRFRITGVGAERRVILDIRGPGLAHGLPYVVTRANFDLEPVNRAARQRSHQLNQPPHLNGPTFDYVAASAKLITGTVREAGNGRPLAGVKVYGSDGRSHTSEAVTDAAGRFRLDGIPKQKHYSLTLRPPDGSPLIPRYFGIADTAGLEPMAADIALVRGMMLSGRVIDRGTGRGARADIGVYALADNPFVSKLELNPDGPSHCYFSGQADADGRFRFPIIPGPAVLTVSMHGTDYLDGTSIDPYLPADMDEQERKRNHIGSFGDNSLYVTAADGHNHPIRAHVIKWISPAAGADPEPLELFVDRGRTVNVRIEDPEGKPLAGTIVAGMTAMWPITFTAPKAGCTLYALQPDKPRTVVFYHPERKNVGILRVRGDETGPLTMRLLPVGGVVVGRLVDADGKAITGANVTYYYPDNESAQELFRYLAARGGPTTRTKTDADGRFRFDNVQPDLRLDLGFKKGTTELTGPAGFWFGPYRVAAGKTLDLGELKTKPADR